jgi:hypothetical protein
MLSPLLAVLGSLRRLRGSDMKLPRKATEKSSQSKSNTTPPLSLSSGVFRIEARCEMAIETLSTTSHHHPSHCSSTIVHRQITPHAPIDRLPPRSTEPYFRQLFSSRSSTSAVNLTCWVVLGAWLRATSNVLFRAALSGAAHGETRASSFVPSTPSTSSSIH